MDRFEAHRQAIREAQARQERQSRFFMAGWVLWFMVSAFLLPWFLVTFILPHVHLVFEWIP